MKQLKYQFSLIVTIYLAPLLFIGCAGVLPGNDSVVVRAEQTIAISADAFETFLQNEDQTHAALCAVSQAGCREVHAFAEHLRTKVPNGKDANGNVIMSRQYKQWLQSAATLKEAYQAGKTPDNKRNLQQILDTITAAVSQAQKYLVQLKAVKGA